MGSRVVFIILMILCYFRGYTQSKLSLQGGWTASKVRAYDKSQNIQGPAYSDLVNFPMLHSAHMGIEYEYTLKHVQFSTGLSFMTFGSTRDPYFGYIWPNFYWVVPILGGYKVLLRKDWNMIIEGGLDVGLQQGYNFANIDRHRVNVNVVLGVELGWRRFRLGTRFHWGLTDFRVFEPIHYKHTGLTTYISYDIWDHAKSKARRLKKQQEKHLE